RRTLAVEAYEVTAFLCQQAAEKMLKAAYLAVRQEEAPRTHTLARLLEGLGAPSELVELSHELTRDYFATRYPDGPEAVSPEEYGRGEAEDRLGRAERVMAWARGLMEDAGTEGDSGGGGGGPPSSPGATGGGRGAARQRTRPGTPHHTSDALAQQFMAEVYPRLRDEWRAKHVLLYGSRVRGDADEWSDLDVIVVSDAFAGMRFLERMSALQRAVDPPIGVEMFCYTPDEFERKRREPGVVATACREGVWLD
ncbi:MAG: HEPN domain-containing protein, partial [Armatimonadota bacterium]